MSKFHCDVVNNGIIPAKKRIIVIGDLHADFMKTKQLFIKLKLIDSSENWIAQPPDTTIVQLGDQLDGGGRGEGESYGELNLINFMEDLHLKAKRQGGGVYSLIGNHEIMNMIGDFKYASNKDISSQGGIQARKKLYSAGNDLFNRLSCTRNVVLKVGDFVFAHAGILPEHITEKNKDNFIKKINTLMRLFLQGAKSPDDEEIQKYFLSHSGIIWNREYGNEQPRCDKFDKISKMLNVGHMIIGHTIQNNINSKCDNKLWRVDVGISGIFKTNNMEVLEILDDGVPMKSNNFQPFRVLN